MRGRVCMVEARYRGRAGDEDDSGLYIIAFAYV